MSGQTTTLASGVLIATGLIPDAYDITVTATGYQTWTLSSVNIPGNYPDPVHNLTVRMQPIVPPTTTTTTTTIASTTTTQPGATTTTTVAATTTTTTVPASTRTVTFNVNDNTGRNIHGATITITRSGYPAIVITTDDHGDASYNLVQGVSYTATASTTWGHGPDSETFNPQYTGSVNLDMTRPWGKGTMVLQGGDRAEFLYRAGGLGSWIVLPANYEDEASFVADEGSFEVAKRCLANGQVLGTKTVSVGRNENRSTSISGWCP